MCWMNSLEFFHSRTASRVIILIVRIVFAIYLCQGPRPLLLSKVKLYVAPWRGASRLRLSGALPRFLLFFVPSSDELCQRKFGIIQTQFFGRSARTNALRDWHRSLADCWPGSNFLYLI